jgi:excisionase family DNA binding protein
MKEISGPFFDIQGVAQYLGISAVTVYRLVRRKNGLPGHRVGGNWRFIKKEVDQWVSERR